MSQASRGWLSLILHAHLPFVRHPEHEEFLEERWLFEAMTETYLPLLERWEQLANDGVPFRLTLSMSPTLLTMWSDPLLQTRYVRHLDRLVELTEREIQRTRWRPPFHRLALFYHNRMTRARHRYVDVYRRNLIAPLRALHARNHLELITSCATHGLLPLLGPPRAAAAQIHVGLETFQRAFGFRPAGFWLPELGYARGLDELLAAEGIRYVVVEAHALLFGTPRPQYGVFAPARTPGGLAAFGRDPASARDVWSADAGYPGDPAYREFYRDIGHELDDDYLRPYMNGDGQRVSTGIKYYRVTGATEVKEPYDPDQALERAAQHAADFLAKRRRQLSRVGALMDRPPLIVSPFDAELFGHWWFEGPEWMELVIRKVHASRDGFEWVTPADYLERYPTLQPLQPSDATWGAGGYAEVWLNGANEWIYRHLHTMAERMTQAATAHRRPDATRTLALNQMARELLLAQASDWPFILKHQTHTAYAYRRLNEHIARFTALYELLQRPRLSRQDVAPFDTRDPVFPDLDFRLYADEALEPAPRA